MTSITVYTQPSCGPCGSVKRWLTSQNIPYEEKGIEETISAGYRSTPVTTGMGMTIFGFNIAELNKLKDSYNVTN